MSKAARNKREREAAAATNASDKDAWEEFTDLLNELALAHHFAVNGALAQARHVERFVEKAPDPNKAFQIMGESPRRDKVPVYGHKRIGEIVNYARNDVPMLVGHQWAVTIFTAWDASYRKRVATERGLSDENEVVVPALGDLRLFRNDIVHHHGVATKANSGRAQVFRDWITLSSPIIIGQAQVFAFMEELGLVTWEDQDVDALDALKRTVEGERKRRGREYLSVDLRSGRVS